MNKIGLIIAREYLSRVRKKSFIIMSIVGPVLFGAMFAVPIWLASREGDEKVIEILDESGYFTGKFENDGSTSYVFLAETLDDAKNELKDRGNYGLLYIPQIDLENPRGIMFFAESNPSIEVQATLERKLKSHIERIKLNESGIDQEKLDKIKTNVDISVISLTEKGEKEENVIIATIVGYATALMLYMFIVIYGIQTLRGVIEEKSSKIVEVIISSVKPFQLMMGKILGIGAVGFTQFLLWVVLTFMVSQLVMAIYGIDLMEARQVEMVQDQEIPPPTEIPDFLAKIGTINLPLVVGSFLFYFIGGFFFYGSLYAGVGSAVDSDTDAQQFQLPVTIPLIFSIVLLSAIIREPHGSLAFWASIIPFSSPLVMMMRIPFDPPAWQIALSMVMLVLGFIGTTWIAGRIYRVGILMHGTKVNYKILAKWMMMKN